MILSQQRLEMFDLNLGAFENHHEYMQVKLIILFTISIINSIIKIEGSCCIG
jgi:hypothetical protein